ncbi:hypothetical protein BC835DRAFT_1429826 [Cytidiella melzeri]|nr:hypothetical protein BC835DRAFT_1429826 [Cytidiella melzeri]
MSESAGQTSSQTHVVYPLPQQVIRADDSIFTHNTASPRSTVTLTRDSTTNSMWAAFLVTRTQKPPPLLAVWDVSRKDSTELGGHCRERSCKWALSRTLTTLPCLVLFAGERQAHQGMSTSFRKRPSRNSLGDRTSKRRMSSSPEEEKPDDSSHANPLAHIRKASPPPIAAEKKAGPANGLSEWPLPLRDSYRPLVTMTMKVNLEAMTNGWVITGVGHKTTNGAVETRDVYEDSVTEVRAWEAQITAAGRGPVKLKNGRRSSHSRFDTLPAVSAVVERRSSNPAFTACRQCTMPRENKGPTHVCNKYTAMSHGGINKLGQGTFEEVYEVYKVKYKQKGHSVALKRILVHHEKEGMPVTALREIKILKALRHPYLADILHLVNKQNVIAQYLPL